MVEQSTAASHALALEATELSRLMGQFTMGSVAPRAATRPPAASRSHEPLRAKAYASHGSAAVKLGPAFAAESWEDF